MLAEDLKPFLKIAADRDLQVEMPERAVFEIDGDEPAKRAEPLEQPRAHGGDRPAQEPGRVDQVAAMGEQDSSAAGRPWGRPPAAAPCALVIGIGWRLSVIV